MKFALLTETAKVPARKNDNDAGIDLCADVPENHFMVAIPQNEVRIIPTGVTVEIPKGYFGFITNKSRNNFIIGGGIVDEGYQGELLVKVINPTKNRVVIKHHQPLAQLLIIPCITPKVEVVEKGQIHLSESDRGSTGGIVKQMELFPSKSVERRIKLQRGNNEPE